MSKTLSICIVGAGSSYTPELIEGIIQRVASLPITLIRMTDLDEKRMNTMAELSRRMIQNAKANIRVECDVSMERMLEGVDFVITQIRVGGMQARYLDETIPLKYGLVGQETTGPGGMFKALRTIPEMLKVAHSVEKIAPQAFILNYTNPSGIITQAVSKHSKAKIMGLCSGMPMIQEKLKKEFQDVYPELKTYCIGLNHLSFIHRILSKGRDVTLEAIDHLLAKDNRTSINNADMASMKIAKMIGVIPIDYTRYFFQRKEMFEKVDKAEKKRSQLVMEIEKAVFEESDKTETRTKPESLKRRGGDGYAGITFSCMTAISQNSGEELIVNVPNRGCVEGFEPDDVAELLCRVDKNGATPLPAGKIPMAVRGLVQAVRCYETLTVEAAVQRKRSLVLQALLNHPLTTDYPECEALIDEMLKAHHLNYS